MLIANRDATDEQMWESLEVANASDFVMQLPQGLDTQVGERGVKLSVGEKQRVSVARSLLRNPPILLLDEATASVDTETERLILEALERLMLRAVIAESFAEIFFGNCCALGMPCVLATQESIKALTEIINAAPKTEVSIEEHMFFNFCLARTGVYFFICHT